MQRELKTTLILLAVGAGILLGQAAVGPGPAGSAPVGNPLQIAGSDGKDLRTVSTDSSGNVNVNVQGTVPVSGACPNPCPVTQSGTWTVQPGNTANTTPWLFTVYQGGNAAAVSAANALKVDGSAVTQPVSGTFNPLPQSTSTYATTPYDLAATAATNIKASGGNVYGWFGYNPNSAVCFLQFYNSASPSLGTSVLHPFGIPPGAAWNLGNGIPMFNLSTAISTGQTTTSSGSTQCSSAMVLTILYD